MSDIIHVDYDPYKAFCERIGKSAESEEAKKLWDKHNSGFVDFLESIMND